MPINLSKGQKVDLTKGNPGLTKIMVGLGWDVNSFDTGGDFDLPLTWTRLPSCWAPAESAPRSGTSSSTATSSTAPARWSTWATT